MLNVEAHWWKVEIFTVYQLIAAEMQVRGRVQPTLNDPEPYATLHNVVTSPMLPGAPRLQSIAEAMSSKTNFGVIRTVEPEVAPLGRPGRARAHQALPLLPGDELHGQGTVSFPVAADPNQHREMLLKARFFPVTDATLTSSAPSWPRSSGPSAT